jgi:uncharacterized protein (DUF433 family)
MNKNYVEKRDKGYWISGTRISLDSIVIAFKRGASPETIKRSFPLLSLEQVYGALTFYLADQLSIEEYLIKSENYLEIESEKRRELLKESKPELINKMLSAKEEVSAR